MTTGRPRRRLSRRSPSPNLLTPGLRPLPAEPGQPLRDHQGGILHFRLWVYYVHDAATGEDRQHPIWFPSWFPVPGLIVLLACAYLLALPSCPSPSRHHAEAAIMTTTILSTDGYPISSTGQTNLTQDDFRHLDQIITQRFQEQGVRRRILSGIEHEAANKNWRSQLQQPTEQPDDVTEPTPATDYWDLFDALHEEHQSLVRGGAEVFVYWLLDDFTRAEESYVLGAARGYSYTLPYISLLSLH